MQHIFLTFMVYKERVNNGINYATAAWWTKERAEAIKGLMLARSDIEEVFIQDLTMEDAPQDIKEQNGHIAQQAQAEIAFLESISLALAGGYPREAAIKGVREEIYERVAQLSAVR